MLKRHIMIAMLVLTPMLFAASVYAEAPEDEYVVIFDKEMSDAQVDRKTLDADVESVDDTAIGETIAVVSGDVDTEAIEAQKGVKLVGERRYYAPCDWGKNVKGNDPYLAQQAKSYLDAIGWRDAVQNVTWSKNRPKIAVIGTGVEVTKDLRGNIRERKSVIPGNENIDSFGDNGHETAVAGIIAAKRNNKTAITGMCNAKLYVYNIYTGDDDNPYACDDIYKAIIEAAYKDKVKIINLSIAISGEIDSVTEAALAAVAEKDVLVVCSAGNDSTFHAVSPAALSTPNNSIISVGAVGDLRSHEFDTRYILGQSFMVSNTYVMIRKADFTNYGADVDLMAPGEGIPVLRKDGKVKSGYGTSFSAPIVTGAAGLLLQKNPNLTAHQLKNLLINSSHEMNSRTCRYGFLDLGKAMKQINNTAYRKDPTTGKAFLLRVKQPLYSIMDDHRLGMAGGKTVNPSAPGEKAVICLPNKEKAISSLLRYAERTDEDNIIQRVLEEFTSQYLAEKVVSSSWIKRDIWSNNKFVTRSNDNTTKISYMPAVSGSDVPSGAVFYCNLYGQKVALGDLGRCLDFNVYKPRSVTASAARIKGGNGVRTEIVMDDKHSSYRGMILSYTMKYKYKGKTYKVQKKNSITYADSDISEVLFFTGKHKPSVAWIRLDGYATSTGWMKTNTIPW